MLHVPPSLILLCFTTFAQTLKCIVSLRYVRYICIRFYFKRRGTRLSVSSLRVTQASRHVTTSCQSVCLCVQPHIGLLTSLDDGDTDSKYLIRKKQEHRIVAPIAAPLLLSIKIQRSCKFGEITAFK